MTVPTQTPTQSPTPRSDDELVADFLLEDITPADLSELQQRMLRDRRLRRFVELLRDYKDEARVEAEAPPASPEETASALARLHASIAKHDRAVAAHKRQRPLTPLWMLPFTRHRPGWFQSIVVVAFLAFLAWIGSPRFHPSGRIARYQATVDAAFPVMAPGGAIVTLDPQAVVTWTKPEDCHCATPPGVSEMKVEGTATVDMPATAPPLAVRAGAGLIHLTANTRVRLDVRPDSSVLVHMLRGRATVAAGGAAPAPVEEGGWVVAAKTGVRRGRA